MGHELTLLEFHASLKLMRHMGQKMKAGKCRPQPGIPHEKKELERFLKWVGRSLAVVGELTKEEHQDLSQITAEVISRIARKTGMPWHEVRDVFDAYEEFRQELARRHALDSDADAAEDSDEPPGDTFILSPGPFSEN